MADCARIGKLREGVKFHDGAEFNAEAVKKSIERQLEPNRTSDMPYASFVFGEEATGNGVASVEAVDATTVKITLRAASTPFLKNLAMALASPIVSPTAADAATPGQPIQEPKGTGPYKFVDWTKGASVTLVANEDYWGCLLYTSWQPGASRPCPCIPSRRGRTGRPAARERRR